MAKNNYFVSRTEEGWKAKRNGAERAMGIYDTQKEAENSARNVMRNNGGGELTTQGLDGKIRSKDTINGHETKVKDKEH